MTPFSFAVWDCYIAGMGPRHNRRARPGRQVPDGAAATGSPRVHLQVGHEGYYDTADACFADRALIGGKLTCVPDPTAPGPQSLAA
jgi:hypothetical protein